MAIKERLREIIDYYNLNTSSFSKRIGVSPTAIRKVLNGDSNPSLTILIPLKKEYPEISSDWVLIGYGNMLVSDNRAMEEQLLQRDQMIEILKGSVNDLRKTIELQDMAIKSKDVMIQQLQTQIA